MGLIGAEGESSGDAGEAAPATGEPAVPQAAAEPGLAGRSQSDDASDGEMSLEERIRKFSSPLVRRIAEEEGVNLANVEGSGIHGRVTKADIMAYLETRGDEPEAPAKPAAAAAPAPAPVALAPAPAQRPTGGFSVPAYHPGENVTIEPMDRIRQRTMGHMTYSKATSAHVTTVFHVDMSRVTAIRNKVKKAFQETHGTKLTYMPFIFRAVTQAIRKYPQMNAAIDGTNIVYKNDVNLGMAVALPGGGLIVPVLKNADERSLVGLAKTANDLAERARIKKLKPEEASGGTFTITNPGVYGSLFGTPVINQPQVAILGIGTIEKRAVVVTDEYGNDSLAIRTMCYLAITFDHRLIDGADADHFMVDVKTTLEEGDWDELDSLMR